eukprot:c3896_g1_i1.p1 GENE.c3896_g1_i1~~c3896_g1_i1.p1  ORF type:complete len:108 (-),score=17.02 c3896_g1_i1:46-369(-)
MGGTRYRAWLEMNKGTKSFIMFGLPFISFILASAYGISYTQKPRVELMDHRRRREAVVGDKAHKFDLDEEYKVNTFCSEIQHLFFEFHWLFFFLTEITRGDERESVE